MSAAELLRLIETVDPSDTAKLNEIDYRFFCWLQEIPFTESVASGHKRDLINRYTRSRDALKAIRPKGSSYECNAVMGGKFWASIYFQYAMADTGDYDSTVFESFHMPTEELAELHAILQAIAWERKETPADQH